MTTTISNDTIDTMTTGNIFKRVHRIEIFLLLATISFIALLSHAIHSSQRELQAALSSILELQKSVSSMSRTQSTLTNQIDTINGKIMQYKQQHSSTEAKAAKNSSTNHRKALSTAKNNVITRSVKPMQNAVINTNKVLHMYSREQHTRNMQLDNTNSTQSSASCNETLFRSELQLDGYPEETSIVLMNIQTEDIVINETFDETDVFANVTFEMCIENGHYQFRLSDSFGDGIQCVNSFDGLPCYNIYINDVLAIPGRPFQHSLFTHEFDSNSICIVGDVVVLEYNFDIDETLNDRNDIKHILINTETNEQIEMLPIPHHNNNTHSKNKTSYFQCIVPSIYEVEIYSVTNTSIACDGPCFTISVNNEIIINGHDMLESAKHRIFLTVDGIGNEHICHSNPLLSPINDLSLFEFDERVSKILNIIIAISNTTDMFTVDTSQYRATCYILYDDPLQMQAEDVRLMQRYTLAVLLFSTNEMTEVELAPNACNNDKFECNEQGKILRITLNGGGSNGYIPGEIRYLDQLEVLSLASKDLKGPIPTDIALLRNLSALNLADNELTGTIPTEIGSLPLEELRISENKLTGSIPTQLGNVETLIEIWLDDNLLTGIIPSELFNSRSLEYILLNSNNLDGTIPEEIGRLHNLLEFTAYNNQLRGTLPSGFANNTFLELIDLAQNSLTGTIPVEFEKIQFESLYLEDNLLTGSIPNLNATVLIYLRNNSLTGSIPQSIFSSRISSLTLDNNQLVGEVTQAFCDNLTAMEDLDNLNDLFVDDSTWFLDEPLVTCPCCEAVGCHMWENNDNVIIVGGTRRPSCPPSNIVKRDFYQWFTISDDVADVSHFVLIGDAEEEMSLCLSPTGCFTLKYDVPDGKDDWTLSWDRQYKLGYSSASKSLQEHDTCDAVDVCGVLIGPDHPKRTGLNHLAHIALPDLSILDSPSLPQHQALCWIMTQDPMFHDYNVCDGTLLQRYVMVLFYYTYKKSLGFNTLIAAHTCDWPNVTCDPLNKFIEHVDFSGMGLEGWLVSELGLLTRLKTLVLSGNSLTGTIDESMFEYMPDLALFNVSFNEIGGRVPKTLLQSSRIEDIVLSNNFMLGELPDDIEYSKNIRNFDVENNLFTSFIPTSLIACSRLEKVNLSRNNFRGNIPSGFGLLQNMHEIRLDQNALSGSIPKEIFNLKNLERFEIQSNSFTGTIPTEIGKWESAAFIILSHNLLKGAIPKELKNLHKVEYLHLHDNFLTGAAPNMAKLQELGRSPSGLERYITDCGEPSFLLANPLECPSCTLCCNSNKLCQENLTSQLSIEKGAFIAMFGVPIALIILFFLICYGSKVLYQRMQRWDERDVLKMVDVNSTYCLLFSNSYVAWMIYFVVYFLQGCFYYLFLLASSFTSSFSDWQFTIYCSSSIGSCDTESSVSVFGWILFFVVTLFTLSVDYVNSTQLILKSVAKFNLRICINGFLHLGMTVLALFCSFYYNMALATTDTELIVNAVILLFVNDLDEQLMNAMNAFAPDWVDARIGEMKEFLTAEEMRTRPRESVLPSWPNRLIRERKSSVFTSFVSNVPQTDLFQEDAFVEHSPQNEEPAIETIFVRTSKYSH